MSSSGPRACAEARAAATGRDGAGPGGPGRAGARRARLVIGRVGRARFRPPFGARGRPPGDGVRGKTTLDLRTGRRGTRFRGPLRGLPARAASCVGGGGGSPGKRVREPRLRASGSPASARPGAPPPGAPPPRAPGAPPPRPPEPRLRAPAPWQSVLRRGRAGSRGARSAPCPARAAEAFCAHEGAVREEAGMTGISGRLLLALLSSRPSIWGCVPPLLAWLHMFWSNLRKRDLRKFIMAQGSRGLGRSRIQMLET